MRPAPGFTLIELMVVVVIIGVLVLLVSLRFERWSDAEAVKSSARNVEGAFQYARSEAIRTGNNHIIFFQTDIGGSDLLDASGEQVPILVLNDGRPGSANQNCVIDGGETVQGVRLERNTRFGTTSATAAVPLDEGSSPFAGGFSFRDSDNNPATWVLFRPDGTPRAVNAACDLDDLGSGGGAVYLSNAERDAAVVLTPLGASRVFVWNGGTSTWN